MTAPRRPPAPAVLTGRNAPCPCGSGEKYKKCCLFDVEIAGCRVGIDRPAGRVAVEFRGVGVISLIPEAAKIIGRALMDKAGELAGEPREDDDAG